MIKNEVVEFVTKEFGFPTNLVKIDKVSTLDHFNFQVLDYVYQADVTEDCGNGYRYYSLSIVDHL